MECDDALPLNDSGVGVGVVQLTHCTKTTSVGRGISQEEDRGKAVGEKLHDVVC